MIHPTLSLVYLQELRVKAPVRYTILSNYCGLPFGVTRCCNFLGTLSSFTNQVISYFIFHIYIYDPGIKLGGLLTVFKIEVFYALQR